MIDGCNLLSKNKIDIKKLINDIELTDENVLFVQEADDWLKRKNENVVIEYNGVLGEDDTDDYVGYHYYNVSLFVEGIKENFRSLKDIIVEFD